MKDTKSDGPKSDQQRLNVYTKSNEPELQVGTLAVDSNIRVHRFVQHSNGRLHLFTRKCKISEDLYSIDKIDFELVRVMKELTVRNRHQISMFIKQKLGSLQKGLEKESPTVAPAEQSQDCTRHEEDDPEELGRESQVQNGGEVSLPEECMRSSENIDKSFNEIESRYVNVMRAVRSHDDLMRKQLKDALAKIAKHEETILRLNEELHGLRVSDSLADVKTTLTKSPEDIAWNDENFNLIRAFGPQSKNPLRGTELAVPKFHTEDPKSGNKLVQRVYYQSLNFDVGGEFAGMFQKDNKHYGKFIKDDKSVYVSCPYSENWITIKERPCLKWVVIEEME
ncbi:hypothetical protein BGZ60DRAFT_165662 [Tricladium varicosporioides]|nr:hypothetical protein BGZ60DRAFT_165662 [Hymenoscyphus varicosporioides]